MMSAISSEVSSTKAILAIEDVKSFYSKTSVSKIDIPSICSFCFDKTISLLHELNVPPSLMLLSSIEQLIDSILLCYEPEINIQKEGWVTIVLDKLTESDNIDYIFANIRIICKCILNGVISSDIMQKYVRLEDILKNIWKFVLLEEMNENSTKSIWCLYSVVNNSRLIDSFICKKLCEKNLDEFRLDNMKKFYKFWTSSDSIASSTLYLSEPFFLAIESLNDHFLPIKTLSCEFFSHSIYNYSRYSIYSTIA